MVARPQAQVEQAIRGLLHAKSPVLHLTNKSTWVWIRSAIVLLWEVPFSHWRLQAEGPRKSQSRLSISESEQHCKDCRQPVREVVSKATMKTELGLEHLALRFHSHVQGRALRQVSTM